TMRNEELPFRSEVPAQQFLLRGRSEENMADIRAYLVGVADRPSIREYLGSHRIDPREFIDRLGDKSEGNFMYLRYVLPELEAGAYQGLEIASLPAGLEDYYEENWQRMRGRDTESWFAYKLPVLVAL